MNAVLYNPTATKNRKFERAYLIRYSRYGDGIENSSAITKVTGKYFETSNSLVDSLEIRFYRKRT